MPSDFQAAGLRTDDPQVVEWGTRRGIFRAYTSRDDRESASEVRALLAVFSLHVRRLEARFEYEEVDHLHRSLHREGLCYSEGEITENTSDCPGFYASPTGRWPPDCFRLFISHVSSNRQWVTDLSDLLQQDFGITGFVAHVSIEHSLEWQREIEDALREMDALLAVFSEGFRGSEWADQEVGFGLGRDVQVVNVLHGADPHGFTARWQAIPAIGRELTEVAANVCSALARDPRSREPLGEALAARFASSRSYESARNVVERLAEAAPLSERAIRIAARAFRHNPECRYAAGVKEKLSELVGQGRLESLVDASSDAAPQSVNGPIGT